MIWLMTSSTSLFEMPWFAIIWAKFNANGFSVTCRTRQLQILAGVAEVK
jgi:hypothetical protein